MDPETAHSTLTMIAQATATLVGLLIIGAVFYIERSQIFRSRISWMKDTGLVTGPLYRSFIGMEVSFLFVALFFPLIIGVRLIFDTVGLAETIPLIENGTIIDPADSVHTKLRDFREFLYSFGFGVSIMLIIAYILPEVGRELLPQRDRFLALDTQLKKELDNDIANYEKDNLKNIHTNDAATTLKKEIRKGRSSELSRTLLTTQQNHFKASQTSIGLSEYSFRTKIINLVDDLSAYFDDAFSKKSQTAAPNDLSLRILRFARDRTCTFSQTLEHHATLTRQKTVTAMQNEMKRSLIIWKRKRLRKMLMEEYQ